jgi:endonuclease/exonuclease/phosphatase family metal-dependent hydrolase
MTSLVELLQKRIKSADRWAKNAILLGDFNVFTELDKTFAALTKAFRKPLALDKSRSNVDRTKAFDQIAFLAPDVETQLEKARGGVFDFYQYVYRVEDRATYNKPDLKVFRDWRTYQMSDHLPIWVELLIDFGIEYLERKTDPTKEQSPPPPVHV